LNSFGLEAAMHVLTKMASDLDLPQLHTQLDEFESELEADARQTRVNGVELSYARAANKRIIVCFSPKLPLPPPFCVVP